MPGRLSLTWMIRAGMAYQRSGADDGSATLSSPLLERSAKEGSGDGRHRRMARRDLRRASDQRPPPRLLLAAAAIGGEADFERQHHVDEGLEGDADEQRTDQIDDLPLLKRDRERGEPVLLRAGRCEVRAGQLFEGAEERRVGK